MPMERAVAQTLSRSLSPNWLIPRQINDPLPFQRFCTTSVGPLVFITFIAVCFLIVLWATSVRWLKQRHRLKPSHSGALRYAAANGDIDALQLVASQRNFTADDDHDGFTALHAAAVCGQAQVAEWLLLRGANPSAIKNNG
jgi:Ankyrin repeats (3 copies)